MNSNIFQLKSTIDGIITNTNVFYNTPTFQVPKGKSKDLFLKHAKQGVFDTPVTYKSGNTVIQHNVGILSVPKAWLYFTGAETSHLEAELLQYLPRPRLVPSIHLVDVKHTFEGHRFYSTLPSEVANIDGQDGKDPSPSFSLDSHLEHVSDLEILFPDWNDLVLYRDSSFSVEDPEFTRLTAIINGWKSGELTQAAIAKALFGRPATSFVAEAGVEIPVGDVLVRAHSENGNPLKGDRLKYVEVPEMFIQILYAIRAWIIVFIDSAGVNARMGLEPDYVGEMPSTAVYSAMEKMSSWSLEDFVPNCNYFRNYFLASCLDNPLPPVPESWSRHGYKPNELLFSGPLGVYLRRLSRPLPTNFNVAENHFRANFSIAQSKKAFAPVPDSFVIQAYEKHRKILTKECPSLSSSLEKDLEKFLRVFFRNFHPKDLVKSIGSMEASINASNNFSRSEGGTREEIRDAIKARFGTTDHAFLGMHITSEGVKSEYGLPPLNSFEIENWVKAPIVHKLKESTKRMVKDYIYERSTVHLNERLTLKQLDSMGLTPTKIRGVYLDEDKHDHLERSLLDKPFAMVRGILEPLKVRTITAMAGPSSYFSKGLQKSLFNYLSRYPQFNLTNTPFQESMMYDLLDRHTKLFGDDSEWDFVSGDYSSATDNLNINATKIVLNFIISKLSDEDKILIPHFEEILLEQVLIYPKEAKNKIDIQKNGQLMGSVLSFPILCILNLFTYFMGLPDNLREDVISGRIDLKSLPVLVNGDDILFRANGEFYQRWAETGKQIGFDLSVGKNFVHPTFFTVNSLPLSYERGRIVTVPARVQIRTYTDEQLELFGESGGRNTMYLYISPVAGSPAKILPFSWSSYEDDYTDEEKSPSRVTIKPKVNILGFPNVGLLIGKSKTASNISVKEKSLPLSGWYDGAVKGAMYPQKMSNYFFNYHRKEITKQTKFGNYTLNAFAHPYLGGLGFSKIDGVDVFFTERQRALASKLLDGALTPYRGEPSLYPLKPLLSLVPNGSEIHSIGNRPGLVEVTLGSFSGPYSESEREFHDRSSIHVTPLAMSYGDLDDISLNPNCRLTDKELGKIMKNAKHGARKTLAVEDMTKFPYRPIVKIYVPETEDSVQSKELLDDSLNSTPSVTLDENLTVTKEEQLNISDPIITPSVEYDDSWEHHVTERQRNDQLKEKEQKLLEKLARESEEKRFLRKYLKNERYLYNKNMNYKDE